MGVSQCCISFICVENGRARSRVRDSTATKREPSSSRRERDPTEPRERLPRGERERDEHKREKDESRRDRDNETEEDARRWREDGKRDERLAARRDRGRDKVASEQSWEGATERRWPATDEKDGRYKRTTGRERKPADETKDKDDRRDRERQRERESEPAWMDTYVPTDSSPGILGGQSLSGELDGIQAWKKGLKEKESKEKEASAPPHSKGSGVVVEQSVSAATSPSADKPLDEIQLFKLLMKKEQETKRPETAVDFESVNKDSNTSPQQRQRVVTTGKKRCYSRFTLILLTQYLACSRFVVWCIIVCHASESRTHSISSLKAPVNSR